MNHTRSLLYILGAILVLNVIAIVFLQLKLVDEQKQLTAERMAAQGASPETVLDKVKPTIIVAEKQPLVRMVVVEDKTLCPSCFDINLYIPLVQERMNITVERATLEETELNVVPAFLFSEELVEYTDSFSREIVRAGYKKEYDEGRLAGSWFVLPTINPPYYDLANNVLVGELSVTYLGAHSCRECYDVELNRQFLDNVYAPPTNEYFFDADSIEGRAIISTYDITAVPTIVITGEPIEYPLLRQSWDGAGTVEKDGAFVLRNLQKLKVIYYDLAQQKVMRP